ncbi:MAG: DUF3379 family protein [Proteobacteria bacterium]|nr:DUF3379 family protein [Pseudomonadota bacterium]
MNYFKFKKILDSDPFSDDADFNVAKDEDFRCRTAYEAAMQQEKIFKTALQVPVPSDYKDEIIFNQCGLKKQKQNQKYWAIAASFTLIVSFATILWFNNQPGQIENFINNSMMMEPEIYMRDEEIPADEIRTLFASLDTDINEKIGKLHFLKICPTPNGLGARMVMINELNQPITILYMPNTSIDEQIEMNMKDFKGKIIALEKGVAAIVGRPHQEFAQIEQNLLNSIKPLNRIP